MYTVVSRTSELFNLRKEMCLDFLNPVGHRLSQYFTRSLSKQNIIADSSCFLANVGWDKNNWRVNNKAPIVIYTMIYCRVQILPYRSSIPLFMCMRTRDAHIDYAKNIRGTTIRAGAANKYFSLLLSCGSYTILLYNFCFLS